MIFENYYRGEKLTGWGKNGPAYFFPGERMGRPILSPGKKLTGGKFRPVTLGLTNEFQLSMVFERDEFERPKLDWLCLDPHQN